MNMLTIYTIQAMLSKQNCSISLIRTVDELPLDSLLTLYGELLKGYGMNCTEVHTEGL